MKLVPTSLREVVVVEPVLHGDERGWFMETFNEPRWRASLGQMGLPLPRAFVQDNHSCSSVGVLRGLHYQRAPRAQGKLVRVVRGAAYDVAVDIRRDSPTFGRWVAEILSAQNRRQIWIPEGFAHGFLALEEGTELLYKTTDVYDRTAEGAIAWNDTAIGIAWPLSPGAQLRLAAKDASAPPLADAVLD